MATIASETQTLSIVPTLNRLAAGETLSRSEAAEVMDAVMTGVVPPVQIAGLLTALRMRGETVDEVTGFAETMRSHSLRVELPAGAPVVDTCGTGGDAACSFNVSTTAAFVVAGAGVRVAKHGNRSMTSQCGSADLLEALGAVISLTPEAVAASIERAGMGFMFAQSYHPAMRHVGPVRRELGIRTVFNILGPLTNPAGVKRQVVGVSTPAVATLMAEVLGNLGAERVLIVSSADGMDELTLAGPNSVTEFDAERGECRTYAFDGMELGLGRATRDDLRGGDPQENLRITRSVLHGQHGAYRDTVLLNAGAALYAACVVTSIADGVEQAAESIDSGKAARAAADFVAATQALAQGADPQ